MITRWNIAQNNFKKFKNLKICEGTKNVRNPHILHTLNIFLVFLRSNFFPGFLKELEVHIVSMEDYKVKYDQN